jgi:predicted dehydrogenase
MDINRRSFVLRSALAAAGAWTLPRILSSCTPSRQRGPNDRVNLAFFGVGNQGGWLLQNFMLVPGVQVVAICDTFAERREDRSRWVNEVYAKREDAASYSSCEPYRLYSDVLQRDDVDAVVIATPDHWHVPLAYEAVKAGKDVYVEKPLGLSIEQGRMLRRLVRQKKAVLQYGTQQRSDPNFRLAAELAVNGGIGKLQRIDAWCPGSNRTYIGSREPIALPEGFDYDLWLGPAPWSPYTADRCTSEGSWYVGDNAIGFIAGWGAHPLDIAQWGNNSDDSGPVHYEGSGGFFEPGGLFDTIENWDVHCRYANGVELHFFSHHWMPQYVEGKRANPETHGTSFWGSDGWVSVDRSGIEAGSAELLQTVYPEDKQLYKSENHYANFIECVRSRRDPASNIDAAVRSDTISHLANILIRSGCAQLEWDPVSEAIVNPAPGIGRLLHRPQYPPYNLLPG